MNLLNLTKSALALQDAISEHLDAHGNLDGVEETISAWSSEVDDALESKYEAIVRLVRDLEARATAKKAEAKHLADSAKRDENTVERLKAWASLCMRAEGVEKKQAGPYMLAFVKNGGVAPLMLSTDSVDEFPERYRVAKWEVSKDAVRKGVEEGNEDLQGLAWIGERSTSLRIK